MISASSPATKAAECTDELPPLVAPFAAGFQFSRSALIATVRRCDRALRRVRR
jgi:hypothetical protein